MKWIHRVFLDHPKEINESYTEHFKFTFIFFIQIMATAFCLLIHGIFPCLFQDYTRNKIMYWQTIFLKRNPLIEKADEQTHTIKKSINGEF